MKSPQVRFSKLFSNIFVTISTRSGSCLHFITSHFTSFQYVQTWQQEDCQVWKASYFTVASLCKGFTLLIKGHAHETGGSDYQLKILKKKKISINYKFALFFHPSRWNLISHFCGGLAHRIIYCIRDAAEEKIEDKCLKIQKPPARQKKLRISAYRYKNHQLGRKNWG